MEYPNWDGKIEAMAEIPTKGTSVKFYPYGSQNTIGNIIKKNINYNKLSLGVGRIDYAFIITISKLNKYIFFKNIL